MYVRREQLEMRTFEEVINSAQIQLLPFFSFLRIISERNNHFDRHRNMISSSIFFVEFQELSEMS